MSDLPKGWTSEKLNKLADRITKGATPTSYGFKYQAEGIAFIKIENVKDGFIEKNSIRHFISEEANLNQKRSILEAGDILFSIAGTIGATCLVRDSDLPANTNQALAIIRGTSDFLLPFFLRYQLESEVARKQSDESKRGGAMNNISLENVGNFDIIIPPLNEQKRIVEKLEKLLGKVEAVQARLDKIPAILKRFRQAVLAAACSGKLTADWRMENKNTDLAFSQLKTNIQSITENYELACKTAKLSRNRKPFKPTCLDDFQLAWDELDDIPECWVTIPLGKTCVKVTDGTHDTPKPTVSGIPFITAKHIRERQIDFENSLFLPKEIHDTIYARCNPQRNDVLLVNIGAGTATPAIICVDFEFSLKNVALLKPIEILLGQYLEFYLLSIKPKVFSEISRGGAQPFMGLELIKTIPFNLPPLEEQKEIVRRVEDLFKFADQIEARYKKARSYTDKLTQSILAKAFRGELVPQDERDEPASVLLERIKAEKVDKNSDKTRSPKQKAVSQSNLFD
jgi:type I restriction enzyme S subunit